MPPGRAGSPRRRARPYRPVARFVGATPRGCPPAGRGRRGDGPGPTDRWHVLSGQPSAVAPCQGGHGGPALRIRGMFCRGNPPWLPPRQGGVAAATGPALRIRGMFCRGNPPWLPPPAGRARGPAPTTNPIRLPTRSYSRAEGFRGLPPTVADSSLCTHGFRLIHRRCGRYVRNNCVATEFPQTRLCP